MPAFEAGGPMPKTQQVSSLDALSSDSLDTKVRA